MRRYRLFCRHFVNKVKMLLRLGRYGIWAVARKDNLRLSLLLRVEARALVGSIV
jgi:hypothetical protein